MRSPADRFVGRQREIVELTAAMAKSPVVTVVGPPGVGKTRLALEVATGFADEVVVVELAPVAEANGVVVAVASALGVLESSDVALVESIALALLGRRMLMVLDNCEHLLAACGALAVHLTTSGRREIRVLATSREPLGVSGLIYRLGPLPTPPENVSDPAAISSFAAVALFVERATMADAGFALSAKNSEAVANVCRQLDGIPLAIELAAARVNLLTPEQLASMLKERLDILQSASPTGVSAHQTMEAAVAWSYDLLSEPEQALLRRLSVFAGATAAAAEEVCAGTGLAPDQVAELLLRLSTRSLVVIDRNHSEPRYDQLQIVRHFAAERLAEAQEGVEARNRHAHWALALAERAEPEITGPDQQAWLRRLDVEADNLKSAMAWLIHDEQAALAIRLGGALTLWWRARGRLEEGRDLLIQALILGQTVDFSAALGRAFWGAGYLDYAFGGQLAHMQLLEHGLAAARLVEDSSTTARILLTMAGGRVSPADRLDNLDLLEESCRLARDAADMWCLAHALALRGTLTAQSPDQELEGRRLVDEAIHVARAAGDSQSLTYALNALSLVSVDDELTSVAAATEMRDVADERPLDRACALLRLGSLALARGKLADAGAYLTDSAALFQRLGNPDPAYEVWLAQSRLATAGGDRSEARRLLETAVAHMEHRGLVAIEIEIEIAYLAASEGHLRAAAQLADSALAKARGPLAHNKDLVAALLCTSTLRRQSGDPGTAATFVAEALELAREQADAQLILDCIEGVAELAASLGDDSPAHCQLQELRTQGSTWSLDETAAAASQVLDTLLPTGARWPGLTPTEASVADLVADGLTNRQISDRLSISTHTVRGHVSNVFAKLAVESRTALGREVVGPAQTGEAVDGPTAGTSDNGWPPLSLAAFQERFPDDAACLEWLWRTRYSPDGVHAYCPGCNAEQPFRRYESAAPHRRWICDRCGSYLGPTSGTVFHASTTPLRDWFYAIYLTVATGCALSAKQLQREIGVSYKTAWRMVDLIRRQLLTLATPV